MIAPWWERATSQPRLTFCWTWWWNVCFEMTEVIVIQSCTTVTAGLGATNSEGLNDLGLETISWHRGPGLIFLLFSRKDFWASLKSQKISGTNGWLTNNCTGSLAATCEILPWRIFEWQYWKSCKQWNPFNLWVLKHFQKQQRETGPGSMPVA